MMDLAVVGEGDKSFGAAVLMVQQEIVTYNEGTNKKLQKIEELVEVAREKMNLLRQMKAKETGRRYINSFGWEAKVRNDTSHTNMQPSFISNASHNLESRISKTRGTKFFDFSEGSKHQEFRGEPMSDVAYIREPIYDEELGAGQECWPGEEFILAAPNRGNLDTPNPLQSENCMSEISKKLEDYQGSPRYDEVPGEDKEDWQREELICIALGLEDFFESNQDFGEGNSVVTKVLACMPDISIPSASKLQGPQDLNTSLDKPRSNCDEAKGVMQLNVSDGRAETLEGKVALVSDVQTLEEDGVARKLSQGCLVDCSHKTKLFDKSLGIKSDLVVENECGNELLDSVNSVEEDLRNKPNEVLKDGDKPRFGSYKVEGKQGAIAEC